MHRKASRLPLVPDEEWVWHYDAGRELGFKRLPGRVVFPIMCGYLDAVRNSEGYPGVSRASLEREKEWRRSAGPGQNMEGHEVHRELGFMIWALSITSACNRPLAALVADAQFRYTDRTYE